MKVYNLTGDYEVKTMFKDLETWVEFNEAKRISSHYDMLEEKWYFYYRSSIGVIYQITQ